MGIPMTTSPDHGYRTWLADAVARLSQSFSVEVTPSEITHVPLLASLLAPGTRVYITHLPGPGLVGSAEIAEALAAAGLTPVPHIAARTLEGPRQLDEALARFTAGAGVADVLLIGGGLVDPGPFPSTAHVLQTGLLAHHGITRLGVAGHPEGSPDITPDELHDAMVTKQAYADVTGTAVRLVTQFTFDPTPIVEWEQGLRTSGFRLPIHVGLPGATTPAKLMRYGLRCGVGPSLKVLRKQSGRLLNLAASPAQFPDMTVLGIARAVVDERHSLFEALHYFPFGAIERTLTWAEELRRGEFHITEGGLMTASRRS